MELHFAHEIHNVSKTGKQRLRKKKHCRLLCFYQEAAMRIISFMGLRGRTFANKQIGFGIANY